MKVVPTKLTKYNVYDDFTRLVGIGDEVTLPDFEPLSDTVSGAAFLGEFDDPTVGAFGNMKMDIPFNALTSEALNMLDMLKVKTITLAGVTQCLDVEGNIVFLPTRVVIRGRGGTLKGGSFKAGSGTGTSASVTILAITIVVNGETAVELDKVNPTYKLWGVDQLAYIKANC